MPFLSSRTYPFGRSPHCCTVRVYTVENEYAVDIRESRLIGIAYDVNNHVYWTDDNSYLCYYNAIVVHVMFLIYIIGQSGEIAVRLKEVSTS